MPTTAARISVREVVLMLLIPALGACSPSTGSNNAGRGSGGSGANGGSAGAGTTGAGGAESAGSGGATGASAGSAGATGPTGSGGAGGVGGSAGVAGVPGTGGRGGASGTGGSAGASGAAGRAGTSGTAGAGGRAGVSGAGGGPGGAAGAAECPATATATPGETTQSITVGGMARTFIRHVPPGYTGRTPLPVVIDFHPLGSAASSWKGSTSWASVADSRGFIMIWPNGVANSWNAGRCCRTALEQNIDDVGFVKAIVDKVKREACVDARRVYATGCSNGGGMAFKVACDAADVIAAVAPVDFDCVTSAMVNERSCGAQCAPSRPITEIQFRGTSDASAPYEGGLRNGGTTTFPGALETFMSFGSINMCTGAPRALPGHPTCQTYPACGAGVETSLCTIQGGTHCGSYQSFGIVNVAWEMLQRHTLP